MKKKLTLAIAAYVLMVAGILTYIYCPRTVIKNTAMWYEKDFTIHPDNLYKRNEVCVSPPAA